MACPYFQPTDPLPESAWPKHPRLPLGDPYDGVCLADPLREWTPEAAMLRDCCNLGYARGRCGRFQDGDGPDAYRFTVLSDTRETLRLFYVAEREHRPLRSGTLRVSPTAGRTSDAFEQQARAYAASYLRRKHDPDTDATHLHRR